ncbi:hypothetical protein [Halomarina pelagica]|uniref:hypothetical protein n=1 Tax=Halomarina pelagica TaxID=2961599 RepID=UPI0020C280B7|nr:hypothetical protein [Halomarina sp. BND7]
MTGYYDVVLGVIPVALAGISGTLALAGVELTMAVPIAALVAVAVMGHAMFVNAPTDRPVASEGAGVRGPVNAD